MHSIYLNGPYYYLKKHFENCVLREYRSDLSLPSLGHWV
jgi:hypothetical protein